MAVKRASPVIELVGRGGLSEKNRNGSSSRKSKRQRSSGIESIVISKTIRFELRLVIGRQR